MSRTDRRQLSHPCRIHYVGECGEEGPAPKPINKGFLSHHAAIVTSGMNEGSSFSNGIYLTSYGSQSDSITPGGLSLSFENSNRFNLGSVEHVGINMTNEAMDKVTMIGLGIIVAKDVIKDPLYKGKPTVIATLKHTDYDPFLVYEHFIPPMKKYGSSSRLCVVGREAQFSGLIKDYDGEKFMWECETTSISITSGHLTDIPQSPVKIAGRPAGGRIALTTPVKSSPAWNADEQLTDPYLGANGTGGSSSEAGPSSETNQSSTSDVTDNGNVLRFPQSALDVND
ncbi:hypothetical protein DFH28DRAFT_1101785 [Melampsora americana]|nr:hypothetical protein DFH28DRAFT_1101785 [Melampsora americana]